MKMKLKTSCILNVPLQNHTDEFKFIVNGEEFKTTKLISELLSPKISKMLLSDPTFGIFTINTHNKGHFSHILDLINFEQNDFPINELPFMREVIEILGNESIELNDSTETIEFTKDNVFSYIKQHEKYPNSFSQMYEKEISFISSSFYELNETKEEEFKTIQMSTLYRILNHKNLKIKTEDQLLNFVNKMYSIDSKYSILYESILFKNVTSDMIMNDFFSVFDLNDITSSIWRNISDCFQKETINKMKNRYKENAILLHKKENEELKGVINYLRKQSNGDINKEIQFTSSSVNSNAPSHQPENVANHEEQNKNFCSENVSNSWICFYFNKYKIIPSEYEIRSRNGIANWYHPKSWIIECSNDNISWEILDERKDCLCLNGKRITHTFQLKNQTNKEFRYIRMRSTGPDCNGSNYLTFEAFELYGKLI